MAQLKDPVGYIKGYRFAFCVPDYLGDLWIGDPDIGVAEAIKSSQMRVGPVGLLEIFNADFFILDSRYYVNKEFLASQERIDVTTRREWVRRRLQNNNEKGYRKLVENIRKYNEIDYGSYDFIFVVNDSIPRMIRKRFKGTLFICIPFDGILPSRTYGYDSICTQYTSLSRCGNGRLLGMPYTFIGSSTIETSLGLRKDDILTKSVFMEINNFTSRPPVKEELKSIVQRLRVVGYEMEMHKEDIVQNLTAIHTSRYFVKITGREIRGNAILESISAGTPVLFNPALLLDDIPFDEAAHVHDIESLVRVLEEEDDKFREWLLQSQRKTIQQFVVGYTCQQLINLRCLVFKDGNRNRRIDHTLRGRLKYAVRYRARVIGMGL